MEWSTWLSGAFAIPIMFGLSAWLGKVWAHRILEKDRAKYNTEIQTLLGDLRVRDDKELLVHRLQFEKEFAIYQELWRDARSLALVCQSFHDLHQGTPGTLNKLAETHDTFLETVRSNEPFYAKAVYEAAEAIRLLAVELRFSARRQGRLERAGESDDNVEKLIKLDEAKTKLLESIPEALPRLRDAIRERIWSTRITAWDRSQPGT